MIVVTAPTSNIGRQVLAELLASGREPVRVIARDPARLPAAVRDRVEVVTGSHGDPDVVAKAFAGADTVFWLLPADPAAPSLEAAFVDFARPAVDAFQAQGVERVVGISALGRGVNDNAGYVSGSLAMDDLIAKSGVSYRALVMPSFMDNTIRQVGAIKNQGLFFAPINGARKNPHVATKDIAAAAVRLLLDRSWTGVGSVPVLGPEDLSLEDLAQVMSEVLDRPIRFQQVPIEGFKANLIGNGFSEAMAQGMVDMMVAKDNGLDNAEPRTPEATTPTTFRQWCEEVLKPAVDA